MPSPKEYKFIKERHVKFFSRSYLVLPYSAVTYDTSRMVVLYFSLSGLDLLGKLDTIKSDMQQSIIDWIYSMQIQPIAGSTCGGFRGGSCLQSLKSSADFSGAHITMTYSALNSLLILKDDFKNLNKDAILQHVASLQCSDGSFLSTKEGSENDMRFIYCAACICYVLQDFSPIDIQKATDYILKSQSYEGGFGQGPLQEAHGGSTYCALATLKLMDQLSALSEEQVNSIVRWLILRQVDSEGGLNGRPNKPADTCYTFWVGASLQILGKLHLLKADVLEQYVLSAQDPITGGLGKHPGTHPDGLHSYLALSGMSLVSDREELNCLTEVNPSLNISQTAFEHLVDLQTKY